MTKVAHAMTRQNTFYKQYVFKQGKPLRYVYVVKEGQF